MKYYFCYLLLINAISFIVAVTDKIKALRNKWRISELSLFLLAIFGGSVGLLLGLLLCNHKTRKKKFMIGIPVIIIIQVVLSALFL